MKIDWIENRIIYILDPETVEEIEKKAKEYHKELCGPDARHSYAYEAGAFSAKYEILRKAYNELKDKVNYLENQLKTKEKICRQ